MAHVSRESFTSRHFFRCRVRALRAPTVAAIVFTAMVVLSCESGGGIGPTKETPVIANITGNKTAVELSPGTSTTVAYTVERGGGYSGSVTLSIDGVPTGVTASFSPPLLDKSSVSTVLKIVAAPGAAALSKTLTIKASGDGVDPKTLPLTVTLVVPAVTVTSSVPAFSTVPETPIVIPLTITRIGVLTDIVTLTVQNLPPGVTAAFSTAQLAPDVSTSTLTLTPAFVSRLGLTNITVHAASIDANTDLVIPITINDFSSPTYRINLGTTSFSAVSGAIAITSVTVLRGGGFNGSVALTATGAPAGSVASFTPSSITPGDQATLSVAVPGTTAPGSYQVTVHGTATGLPERTTTVTLNAVGAPGFTISLSNFASGRNVVLPLSFQVSRTGFYSSGITLTLDTQAGFSIGQTIIAPTTFAQTNGTVNLAINGLVTPGTYQLTFRAVGNDGFATSTTVTATITN